MATRSTRRHHRIGRATAVAVAGGVLGVCTTFAIVSAEQSAQPASRSSLETRAVAEWARSHGLTGLSPASLAAPERDTDAESDVDARAAEMAAIAEFAVEEGLTGLSPASLGPVSE
jgi:hypothetical protein